MTTYVANIEGQTIVTAITYKGYMVVEPVATATLIAKNNTLIANAEQRIVKYQAELAAGSLAADYLAELITELGNKIKTLGKENTILAQNGATTWQRVSCHLTYEKAHKAARKVRGAQIVLMDEIA